MCIISPCGEVAHAENHTISPPQCLILNLDPTFHSPSGSPLPSHGISHLWFLGDDRRSRSSASRESLGEMVLFPMSDPPLWSIRYFVSHWDLRQCNKMELWFRIPYKSVFYKILWWWLAPIYVSLRHPLRNGYLPQTAYCLDPAPKINRKAIINFSFYWRYKSLNFLICRLSRVCLLSGLFDTIVGWGR